MVEGDGIYLSLIQLLPLFIPCLPLPVSVIRSIVTLSLALRSVDRARLGKYREEGKPMKKAKGTFWTRLILLLLAGAFGLLVLWSAGFLLDDIRAKNWPNYQEFSEERIDESMQEELGVLNLQLKDLDHQHDLVNQQRGFIKDSSKSLKITVDHLFNLKDKGQGLISETQFSQVLATLDKVIQIQDEFKETAELYLQTTNERFELSKQIRILEERIAEEKKKIHEEYDEVLHDYKVKVAVIQLAVLIPLTILCCFLWVKRRDSIYRMIYRAAALAIYFKTFQVLQQNFPERYFKYIVVIVMLLLVGWGFVRLMRRQVKPQVEALLQQYRQAYERFLCPVCDYPIRIGPRKFLYWTRRTVHKTALAANTAAPAKEESYCCPSCGTDLFEECESCGKICHSLLPNCQHCGNEKMISGDAF